MSSGVPDAPLPADTAAALQDAGRPPLAGARRREVLASLRESAASVTAADVADRTGLHVTTARFHLDALVEDGFAERRPEQRGSRGRPRILYAATPQGEGPRSYRLLGHMLAGLVATLDGDRDTVRQAGATWGRSLAAAAFPGSRDGGDDGRSALEKVDDLMQRVGFDPEPGAYREGELRMRNCPFREVASERVAVVCTLHHGLIQGALEELGAGVDAASLHPFVTPRLCVAPLVDSA